jgi:hypothetical protein
MVRQSSDQQCTTEDDSPLSGQSGNLLFGPSLTAFETKRSFGSIHSISLSALVADRAVEAWYDPPLHE